MRVGEIYRVAGALVVGKGIPDIVIGEVVEVGDEGLIGEVIRIIEDQFAVQVYEPTSGLKPGDPIRATGKRLVAELGPGLLENIFDGVGRPLDDLIQASGPFISRGIKAYTLPRDKKWEFKPVVKEGVDVEPGDIIGEVQETINLVHRIMVPPGVKGKLIELAEGEYTVTDVIGKIESPDGDIFDIRMMHEWPVREPRPIASGGRLTLDTPLITGQRVIDVFFPVAKGGAASIPGGFGTGKTITLHQLAKWSDADIVVYIGCGERGNEMAEVLTDFPELKDPRTGRPLMERTVLIANTSNMPVSAREASVYIGVTIAEYYRDMGYDVALMADSTSRWAEAIREISGRLGEMPVERGFPAYLPDKIAEFYERAGRVRVLGRPERIGSVTIIGAVSPPGGDFNEPVTIHTLRFTGVFWALDADLAYSRHFPAINWLKSYSLYTDQILGGFIGSFSMYKQELINWWKSVDVDFPSYRERAMDILTTASEVESIARIIGEKSLPDDQRLLLLTSELLKEGFLRQNAFDEVDTFSEPEKSAMLLKLIIDFHDMADKLIRKRVPIERIMELPIISKIKRVKFDPKRVTAIFELADEVRKELAGLADEYRVEVSI
jgi:V/A-type H+-transporting ATPase subunit A